MSKYRVVIIDDEHLIIEGLKILIDWEEYDCEILGSATDGDAGLELIRQTMPDIVITDIRMPNTTGIEMIRSALSVCNCKFIVLSGYSDFNYARQCMSLGVQEYLLKPVEEELLIQAILKIQSVFQEEENRNLVLAQLEVKNEQLLALSKDYFLRDFMNTYFDTLPDFLSTLSNYEINFPTGEAYACSVLEFPDHKGSILDLRGPLAQVFQEFFPEKYLLFSYNDTSFMNVLAFDRTISKETLADKLAAVKNKLQESGFCTTNIGIGNIYHDLLKIHISAKQAQYALSFQIVRGGNSINPFSSNLKNAHFILSVPNELWENFNTSVMDLNFTSISKTVESIFDYMRELKDMPILGVQINSLNLILTCLQQLNELDTPGELIRYEDMDCFNQIATLTSVDSIAKYVENVIYNLINTVKNTNTKKTASIIPQVENYLHDHIFEDLSLISVAQLFYISPIYLSQLFKKETGQLYIDYLTNLKMNAAKKLLMTTDMMVYEVSDKLGYKDSKYFSRLFEKKLGCKPSEYRRNRV